MTRLGVPAGAAVELIRDLSEEGTLEVEGIYTHFAVADDPNARGIAGWGKEYTQRQLEMFLQVASELDRVGLGVRYRHAANSPATLSYREARLEPGAQRNLDVRAASIFQRATSKRRQTRPLPQDPAGDGA